MTPSVPITPKKPGQPLRVTVLGRISTPGQDVASIASQHHESERWLRQQYDGPVDLLRLGEQASGNLADRPSAVEAREEVSAGRCDLLLVGEIREIFRAPHLLWGFFYHCVDHGTRVIAVADNVDTADESWEMMLHVAALRAGLAVPEARRRVRRKATFSFHQGSMVLKVRYGYRRLTKEQAESGEFGPRGLRIAKRPECTPVIREMRERVLRGDSLEQVSEWLNDEGVAAGDYVRSGRWTAAIVGGLLRHPIVSGTRRFRDRVCVPVHTTGKTRRVRNDSPDSDAAPGLAHLTEEEQAEVVAALDARARSRHERGEGHRLYGKPRSRTLWPGQSAVCGACGAVMHSTGTFLRCSRSTAAAGRACWNRVHVPLDMVRHKVLPWLLGVLDGLPDYRRHLAEAAWDEYRRRSRRRDRAEAARDQKIVALEKEAANLTAAIRRGGDLDSLVTGLAAVEAELKAERAARKASLADEEGGGYRSADELETCFDEALPQLAESSTEFAEVLRRVLPVFVIRPVQALDTDQVRPRAELTLRLPGAAGDEAAPFEATAEIDLFEPPVHITCVKECVLQMQAEAPTLRRIGAEVGVGEMTVRRALNYAALMEQAGQTEPYRVLTGPPASASRWQGRPTGETGGKAGPAG